MRASRCLYIVDAATPLATFGYLCTASGCLADMYTSLNVCTYRVHRDYVRDIYSVVMLQAQFSSRCPSVFVEPVFCNLHYGRLVHYEVLFSGMGGI